MQRTSAMGGTHPSAIDLRDGRVSLHSAAIYSRDRGLYETSIKPIGDMVFAILLVIVFTPLMVACALAVAMSMGRPVILRQERVGHRGRTFEIYKFRTMHPDRRRDTAPFDGEDRRISHKRADDPRITRVGRFLRKWSLDETPQFFNVLRGEMSLVGPRPEMVQIVAGYDLWQHARHAVKPGITCLWQISERGDRMLHEATELDIQYTESISMWTDASILLRTAGVMVGLRPGS